MEERARLITRDFALGQSRGQRWKSEIVTSFAFTHNAFEVLNTGSLITTHNNKLFMIWSDYRVTETQWTG